MIAGELLSEAKTFIEDGIHPRVIMAGFRKALAMAMQRIDEIAVSVADRKSECVPSLCRCDATALASTLRAPCADVGRAVCAGSFARFSSTARARR